MSGGGRGDDPLAALLDEVAVGESGRGGAWCVAASVALGAVLVGRAARSAGRWLDDAPMLARRTNVARTRARELAAEHGGAARRLADATRPRPTRDSAPWRARLGTAREAVIAIPFELCELGADTAALAERLAAVGAPQLRTDAAAGARLAAGGARAAAVLVAAGVGHAGADPRSERARALAAAAEEAAAAAEVAAQSPVRSAGAARLVHHPHP